MNGIFDVRTITLDMYNYFARMLANSIRSRLLQSSEIYIHEKSNALIYYVIYLILCASKLFFSVFGSHESTYGNFEKKKD